MWEHGLKLALARARALRLRETILARVVDLWLFPYQMTRVDTPRVRTEVARFGRSRRSRPAADGQGHMGRVPRVRVWRKQSDLLL
jgi:hypothetical protein